MVTIYLLTLYVIQLTETSEAVEGVGQHGIADSALQRADAKAAPEFSSLAMALLSGLSDDSKQQAYAVDPAPAPLDDATGDRFMITVFDMSSSLIQVSTRSCSATT